MSTIQLLHNNLPPNTDMGEYWCKRSLVTDNWWIERKEYNARAERMKKKPIALYNSIDRMKHIADIPVAVSHKNSTKISKWYRRYAASLQLVQIIESILFGLCRRGEQTIIWWRVGDWKNAIGSRTNLKEALHEEGHQQIIETIRDLIRRGADVNFKNSLNTAINRADECEKNGDFNAEMPTQGADTFYAIAQILRENGAKIV